MPLGQMARQNLASRIYTDLRRSLMTGELRPGERLTLRDLAERLGTSQTPVREALLQLGAEGALVMEPGRSIMVPLMTRERFLELRMIRVALEGTAAEAAAGRATPKLVARLARIHDQLMAAKARGDFRAVLKHNQAFHFDLYRAAGLPILMGMIEGLWAQTGPFLNFLYPRPSSVQPGQHSHLKALDALSRGDARAVRAAIEDDIVHIGGPILEAFADAESDHRAPDPGIVRPGNARTSP